MIHVPSPIPEPPAFDAACRQRGRVWLAENPPPAEVTHNLWARFIPELAAGFSRRCGYHAMLDTGGTADHFLSRKHHRGQAYEWANLRYVSQSINSSKKNADDQLLDPFEVGDDWFELVLPDLQLRRTDRVPPALRAKADDTIKRLRLVNGPRIMDQRRFWYREHRQHGLPLAQLRDYAPLVARAVDRWLQAHPPPLPAAIPPR